MGKMEMRPKVKADQKPSKITLSDGREVLSVQCTDTDELVPTRVIRL